ncbi:unnamed protein product [Boreogadus saida]
MRSEEQAVDTLKEALWDMNEVFWELQVTGEPVAWERRLIVCAPLRVLGKHPLVTSTSCELSQMSSDDPAHDKWSKKRTAVRFTICMCAAKPTVDDHPKGVTLPSAPYYLARRTVTLEPSGWAANSHNRRSTLPPLGDT